MTADANTIELLVVGRMTTAGTYGIDFDFSVTGDGAAVDLTQVQKSIGEASALTPVPEVSNCNIVQKQMACCTGVRLPVTAY